MTHETGELWPWIVGYACVFVRLMGALTGLPPFDRERVPAMIWVSAVSLFALIMFLGLGLPRVSFYEGANVMDWALALGAEFIAGLGLGFFFRGVLYVAHVAGQLGSNLAGLGMAANMASGSTLPNDPFGGLLALVIALFLVVSDTHLVLLHVVLQGFVLLPPGEIPLLFVTQGSEAIQSLGADILVLGVRIAGPVLVSGLMIYVVLAAITKVSPQMNVFAFGFILTIPTAFVVLFGTMPEIGTLVLDAFEAAPERALRWLVGSRS